MTVRLYANASRLSHNRLSFMSLGITAEEAKDGGDDGVDDGEKMWEESLTGEAGEQQQKKKVQEVMGKRNIEEFGFMLRDGYSSIFWEKRLKHYLKLITQQQEESRGIRLGGTDAETVIDKPKEFHGTLFIR